MSVTNLTGTSWLIKAAPSISTMSRYINFTSDGSSSVSFIRLRMSSSSPSYIRYYYGTTNYDDVYQKSGVAPGTWTKTGYRTIHITGGDDVTDATLISWLESNATQIITGYTVTFDANGHGTAPSPITDVTSGSTISEPTAPTATGYTFGGWHKEQACTNAWNFSTDTVTQDTTLWAKWTPISYSITYNLDGGTATNPTTYTIETASFTLNNPTKTGYQFDGWTGTGLSEETLTVTIPIGSTGDRAYTAHYTQLVQTYSVTFQMNGHGTNPGTQTVIEGQTATRPATDPTEAHWTFGNWYADSGLTTLFDFSQAINENKTVYAKWTEKPQYTLTFNMQGHGSAIPSQTKYTDENFVRPADPSVTGWAFRGWYQESACTNQFDFNQTPSQNVTAYAKWNKLHTVSFVLNGHGSSIPSQTVENGQTATRPTAPEETGYIFEGWFNQALTIAFDFTTPITQDTTLYARWYRIPTLNWNGNRHNEGYTFKRVEWPNFQEHESYNYITKGSIEYSTEADLKTTGSFDFEGYDIPNVNDLIRVYYDFTDEQGLIAHEPLGTFFVNYAGLDYEDTIKGIKASGTLEGSSVLKVLQDKQVGMPYTVKKNANAVYVADDLIKAAGLQTNLEASGFVLSVDHTFDSGTTYLEMVNWLLTTAGYAEAYPDGNGTVQIVSMATIQSRTVKQTFKNNEQSIMYPEVEEANDWQETPNVVRLLYNTDDACIVAEATNVTGSRASLDARGNREKTYFEEVSDIGDGTKTNLLKQLAEDTLKEQSCDVEYVTLSHAFVPIQILDLIEIEYSDMKWSGLADNISIELEPSTKTQTKIKRTLYEDIVITSSATVYRS